VHEDVNNKEVLDKALAGFADDIDDADIGGLEDDVGDVASALEFTTNMYWLMYC